MRNRIKRMGFATQADPSEEPILYVSGNTFSMNVAPIVIKKGDFTLFGLWKQESIVALMTGRITRLKSPLSKLPLEMYVLVYKTLI